MSTLFIRPDSKYVWFQFKRRQKSIRISTGVEHNGKKPYSVKDAVRFKEVMDHEIFNSKLAGQIKKQLTDTFINEYMRIIASRKSDVWGVRIGFMLIQFNRYCDSVGLRYFNEITLMDIEGYVGYRIDQKMAPKTIREEIRIIAIMFRFAAKQFFTTLKFTTEDIELPKTMNKPTRYFSVPELKIIMKEAGEFKTFFKTLLYTGLRSGDVARLKWSDIHLDSDPPYIQTYIQKTKNNKRIPIAKPLLNVLKGGEPDDLLFEGIQDKNSIRRPRSHLQRILTGHKLPYGNLHTFRHTTASLLRTAGAGDLDIKDILGHSSLKATEIYAHTDLVNLKAVIDKIDEV